MAKRLSPARDVGIQIARAWRLGKGPEHSLQVTCRNRRTSCVRFRPPNLSRGRGDGRANNYVVQKEGDLVKTCRLPDLSDLRTREHVRIRVRIVTRQCRGFCDLDIVNEPYRLSSLFAVARNFDSCEQGYRIARNSERRDSILASKLFF